MNRPRRLTDSGLRAVLSELSASESPDRPPAGFADGVMARIAEEHPRTRPASVPRWVLWPALAAAAAGIAAAAVLSRPEPPDPAAGGLAAARPAAAPLTPEQLEFLALRDEARILAEQVDLLRRLAGEPGMDPFAAAPGPLVRLGGTERMDVFLDLGSFVEPPLPAAGPMIVPASTRRSPR